jgi:hypothetical protein
MKENKDYIAFVVGMVVLLFIVLASYKACGDEVDAMYWPTIYVEVDELVVDEAEFQVRVILQDANDIAGFQIQMSYDRDVIRAHEVHEGVYLSQAGGTYWVEPDIDNGDGVIRDIVCVRAGGGGVSGGGLLFTAIFRARRIGVSPITLSVKLSDQDSRSVYATVENGTVRVVEYPEWDVNQDGVIDLYDLVLVGQWFNRTVTSDAIPNPDVDRNGYVNINDLVKVAQHFGEIYNSQAPARTEPLVGIEERAALLEIRELLNSGPEHADTLKLVNGLLARSLEVKLTTWGRRRYEQR